jgi:hypothetical protein
LAAIDAPVPVQQQTMPCSARPPPVTSPTAAPPHLVDHGVGDAGALVGGERDPHRDRA